MMIISWWFWWTVSDQPDIMSSHWLSFLIIGAAIDLMAAQGRA